MRIVFWLDEVMYERWEVPVNFWVRIAASLESDFRWVEENLNSCCLQPVGGGLLESWQA
jgi:hypothetical protein